MSSQLKTLPEGGQALHDGGRALTNGGWGTMSSQIYMLPEGREGSLMEGNQRDRGYMGLAPQSDDANVMGHFD